MTLTEHLQEIKKRCQNISEEPWINEKSPVTLLPEIRNKFGGVLFRSTDHYCDIADIKFIASARTDVPKLVEALEILIKCNLGGDCTMCESHGSIGQLKVCTGLERVEKIFEGEQNG